MLPLTNKCSSVEGDIFHALLNLCNVGIWLLPFVSVVMKQGFSSKEEDITSTWARGYGYI